MTKQLIRRSCVKAKSNTLSVFLIVILIFLLSLSNCGDIEFGSDDNDGNGGGGGVSTVEGSIEEITPDMSVQGILVQIMDTLFSDETDERGSFTIEGNFSGSQTLEFLDTSSTVFARFNITVPSGGGVKLENITIDNGVVEPEQIEEKFEGEITSLTCTADDSGSLVVSVEGDDFVVVINSGTDIEDEDGDDLPNGCNDLAITNDVEVEGTLEEGQIVADTIIR